MERSLQPSPPPRAVHGFRRFAFAAGAAVLALGLGACGSGRTTASRSTRSPGSSKVESGVRNPCSLTTPQAVAAAFGGTVATGTVDSSAVPDPTCNFSVTGSNLGPDGLVVVFLTPEQTPDTFRAAKGALLDAAPVPGVGDDAFYNPRSTSVEFLKGSTVGTVQAVFGAFGGPPVDPAKVKADTVALAKSVTSGL